MLIIATHCNFQIYSFCCFCVRYSCNCHSCWPAIYIACVPHMMINIDTAGSIEAQQDGQYSLFKYLAIIISKLGQYKYFKVLKHCSMWL